MRSWSSFAFLSSRVGLGFDESLSASLSGAGVAFSDALGPVLLSTPVIVISSTNSSAASTTFSTASFTTSTALDTTFSELSTSSAAVSASVDSSRSSVDIAFSSTFSGSTGASEASFFDAAAFLAVGFLDFFDRAAGMILL